MMCPLTLLSPSSNYAFQRYIRRDKENEAIQEKRYRTEDKLKYGQQQIYKEKTSFGRRLLAFKND